MLKKILFLGLSLFYASSLHPFLTTLYVLKDPGTGQLVYLLGDIHNETSEHKRTLDYQLDALQSNLAKLNEIPPYATILIEGEPHDYLNQYRNRTWKINRGYNTIFYDVKKLAATLPNINLIDIETRSSNYLLTLDFFVSDLFPRVYGHDPEIVRQGMRADLFAMTSKQVWYCFVCNYMDLMHQCLTLGDERQKHIISNILQETRDIFDNFNNDADVAKIFADPDGALLKKSAILTFESLQRILHKQEDFNINDNGALIEGLVLFKAFINKYDSFCKKYRLMLTSEWARIESRIKEFVITLYNKFDAMDKVFDDQNMREKVFIGLLKSFREFVDANILLHIFKNRQKKDAKPVLVIAGEAHVNRVKKRLCVYGYEPLGREIIRRDGLGVDAFQTLLCHVYRNGVSSLSTSSTVVTSKPSVMSLLTTSLSMADSLIGEKKEGLGPTVNDSLLLQLPSTISVSGVETIQTLSSVSSSSSTRKSVAKLIKPQHADESNIQDFCVEMKKLSAQIKNIGKQLATVTTVKKQD